MAAVKTSQDQRSAGASDASRDLPNSGLDQESLNASKIDHDGKISAEKLFGTRIAEIRERAASAAKQTLIDKFRQEVAEISSRWSATDKESIWQLLTSIAEWKSAIIKVTLDRNFLQSRIPPSEVTHLNGAPMIGSYKVFVKEEGRAMIESCNLQVQRTLGPVVRLAEIIVEAGNRSLTPDSLEGLETAKSVVAAAKSVQTALNRKVPSAESLTGLYEAVSALPQAFARFSECLYRAEQAQKLTELPSAFQKRFSRSAQTLADEDERRFRSSDEARFLRLIKEIESAPEEALEGRSPAQKTLRQLQRSTADITSFFDSETLSRLTTDARTRAIIEQMVAGMGEEPEAIDSKSAIEKESAEVVPDEKSSPDELDAHLAGATESPEAESDREFLTLYLSQYGITDNDTIARILPSLTVESVEALERELAQLPSPVASMALADNPDLFLPAKSLELSRFIRKFSQVVAETAGLESYQIFNPVEFPQFFCSSAALEKTLKSAELIRRVTAEVTEDYLRSRQPDATSAQKTTVTQESQPVLHPEQHLIDRLARYVTYPNLAYGILRDGFFYQGAYHSSPIPEGLRDKLLASTFSKKPLPKDLRATERELIGLGLIVRTNEVRAGTADTLAIALPKDLAEGELRELLIAFIDVQNRPAKPPKLPPK